MVGTSDQKLVPRWYFGGLASAGAACCTHPLDLLKVNLQTQTHKDIGLFRMGQRVVAGNGFRSLYNGISASLLRQMTYSMTRFGIYDTCKTHWLQPNAAIPMPFYQKVMLGAVAGSIGGVVGTPADMVNVRMQNDAKLPLDRKRNYNHALDGLFRVARYEGPAKLMNGVSMASTRAAVVTVGQLSMYDQIKQVLVQKCDMCGDTFSTHVIASCVAGGVATFVAMPLDVMKTRLMNSAPGTYKNLAQCFADVLKTHGPSGFYTGFFAAFMRLAPHTVIMFVVAEQLRLRFGYRQDISRPVRPVRLPILQPCSKCGDNLEHPDLKNCIDCSRNGRS